jgi:hypothetical protein
VLINWFSTGAHHVLHSDGELQTLFLYILDEILIAMKINHKISRKLVEHFSFLRALHRKKSCFLYPISMRTNVFEQGLKSLVACTAWLVNCGRGEWRRDIRPLSIRNRS